MAAVHAAAGADVVAHLLQPDELVIREAHAFALFDLQPFRVAGADVVFEGLQHGLLFPCEADDGDEVGEPLDLSFDLAWLGLLVGVPEGVRCPVGRNSQMLCTGPGQAAILSGSSHRPSLKITLFVLSYLLVWAITGIVLLVGWSLFVDFILPHSEQFINAVNGNMSTTNTIYGILLLISGIYQFSPLKKKCLGYCESPLGFFMRRWEDGKIGAIKMGMHHGLYCLGCCWPYFLLMVALGGMNALWMGVFAAIIFAEKVWVKGGLWIARLTGIIFVILGMLTLGGFMILDNPQSMSNDMDMMAMIVLLT